MMPSSPLWCLSSRSCFPYQRLIDQGEIDFDYFEFAKAQEAERQQQQAKQKEKEEQTSGFRR
jgi:hypothetical protein